MFLFIPHFLYILLFLSTIPLPLRLPLPLSHLPSLLSLFLSLSLSLSLTISYTRSVTHSIPQSLAILLSHSRLSYLSCCLAFIRVWVCITDSEHPRLLVGVLHANIPRTILCFVYCYKLCLGVLMTSRFERMFLLNSLLAPFG